MLYQPPSPQQRNSKKDQPQRETNKLRLFLKRSSEPLLNLQNTAQQVNMISMCLTASLLSNSESTFDVENFSRDYFFSSFVAIGFVCSIFNIQRQKKSIKSNIFVNLILIRSQFRFYLSSSPTDDSTSNFAREHGWINSKIFILPSVRI